MKILAGGEYGRLLFFSPHSDVDGKRAIAFLNKLRSLQQLRFILVFGRRVNIVSIAI
ncbi:hypothetical protein [Microcoleus vaginatus]|uniref:hypothetical protein n=1 Tax=Microcoleus vaginatus TaxID=119532 RepID=UPI00168384BD|nr:hypothetical protein [Microcoleus sp. FACHB-84]MBD2009715.1 hypothetical protein [Microcoleus sp. FACHB-45]